MSAQTATPAAEVMITGTDDKRRAHRPTCKRLSDSAVPGTILATLRAGVPAASCCKPRLTPPVDVTPDPKVKARKERHLRNVTPPVVDAPPADAPPELAEPQASEDRVERVRLAKAEHKALQAWIKDGEKPPRPATPNLDALNAENAAGGPKPKARKSAAPRPASTGLFAEAMTIRKALNNHRGKGTKTTHDELVALARELRAQEPDLSQRRAQEVAYWVRKLAVSKGTWAKAWEASLAD